MIFAGVQDWRKDNPRHAVSFVLCGMMLILAGSFMNRLKTMAVSSDGIKIELADIKAVAEEIATEPPVKEGLTKKFGPDFLEKIRKANSTEDVEAILPFKITPDKMMEVRFSKPDSEYVYKVGFNSKQGHWRKVGR